MTVIVMEQQDWRELAMQYARNYISKFMAGTRFQVSDMRVWAHRNGLPVPRSQRSWASIAVALERAGVIERSGFALTPYSDEFCATPHNGVPHLVWRIK